MGTLKKTITFLTPLEQKRGLLVLVLVIGMALLDTAGIASVMPFLAVLGNPEMSQSNPILSTLYIHAQRLGVRTVDDFLIMLGLGSFVFIIVSAAYRTFTHYVMNHYIEMRRHSIGARLLETYLRQPYTFFLDRHSSDLSKIILSEVDQVIGMVIRPFTNMVSYSLVLIAITVLLMIVNPWLALSAAGLLGGLYALVFLSLRSKLTRLGATLVSANKERFMAVGEAFGGIKDIKLIGCEQSYLNRFERPSQQFSATQATQQTINQLPIYVIEAIIFGAILIITVVLMIKAGGISSGALGQILPILGLYTFAAYRTKPAVQNIYQGIASLSYGQAAVDNLYAEMYPNNPPAQLPKTTPTPIKLKHHIALKNLSYAYPKANKPVLVDINLKIPLGSNLGLVGSTGAGKTTLVDIILGLLHPTQGMISIDNAPITEEKSRAWQKSLGYVPQEIFLTDTSLSENIALGIPKDQIDQAQIELCAGMAQVHEFIVKELPAKYQTLVGERGVRLSGGQRQRIGIARALYHNPEVLVFDEGTSALDTLTEQAVMEAIDLLAEQKTIIFIAHRLSTVRNCDQIVLLDQGRVKAIGRYEELFQENKQFNLMAKKV